MFLRYFSGLIVSLCLLAQAPAAGEKVLAIVDGKKVTERDLRMLFVAVDPKMREALNDTPLELLRFYGFMKRLAAMAEKEKLDQQSPYMERLEMLRLNLLASAALDHHDNSTIVTPEEQKTAYEAQKDRFREARIKLIMIPYANQTEELQAQAKAQSIYEDLQKGADFVAMVKAHSKDPESSGKEGDFPILTPDDANVPEKIRDVVFSLKTGETSKPVRGDNGYYIFRMVELTAKPYEAVKDQVFLELKQKRAADWQNAIRRSVDVKLLEPLPQKP